MILNDTRLLSDDVRERLINSGIMHINCDGPLTDEVVLELLDSLADIFPEEG